MIIHLTSNSRNLEEDLPFIEKITELIRNNDSTLAVDWTDEVKQRKDTGKVPEWPAIMSTTLDAISHADILIVEATRYSFMQGYQAALGLLQKKPVLIVSREPLKDRSVSGIKNRLLTIEQYSSINDLDKLVTSFIKANTISTKDLRFNMFIDRLIYNHLRNLSYETGKNRSEIIRDLIYKDMHKED